MRVSGRHPTFVSGLDFSMALSQEELKSSQAQSASLGRRMVGWTNNLLATAVILLVVLTFGFQTIQSWYPKAPESGAVLSTSPILDDSAFQLDFGDVGGRWKRADFVGTDPELFTEMISLTRREIASGNLDFRAQETASWAALSDHLQRQTAAWSDDQGHRIYVQDGPIPLAVACLLASDRATPPDSEPRSLLMGCWTLALPAGSLKPTAEGPQRTTGFDEDDSNAWTLVLCQPQPGSLWEKGSQQLVPDFFSAEFSVVDDTGQTLKKFKAERSLAETRDKIDLYWHEQGWTKIQWLESATRVQGICVTDSGRKIRVDLLSTPEGTQGLVTDQP
jgi:hypothetical protein